ncbi:MAG: MFS transporter [Clostridia bacterium]|nr:MFS transporter [Clostridia bacterium]
MKIRLPRKEKPPVNDPDSYLKKEVAGGSLDVGPEGTIALDSEEDISKSQKKYMGKKEIWMYALAAGGQGMIYAIMSSYISEFYLNVAMLPPMFVLFLMLLARLWDAVNDPLCGGIVDKINPKGGKFRPYVLYTPIPVAILTFFMFFVPKGISMNNLMIYSAVIYTLWGMIYTISDVPFWSMPNAMTPNASERGKTISIARTINGVGSALPIVLYMLLSMILPKLTSKTGVEFDKIQYMVIALICAILGSIIFLTSYFTTKERVVVPRPAKRDKSEPSPLKLLFTCKPLMLVVAMGVLASGRYLVQVAAIHVARYSFYIGPALSGLSDIAINEALASSRATIATIFQVCSAVGMFGAMLFLPKLYRKYNYKQIVIVTCLAGFVASVAMTIVGWFSTFWACIPFIIISSIPLGVINVTSYAMIGDALDYMEWKTGRRETALGSSTQSFINKLGNALATSFIVVTYLIFSIDPAAIVASAGAINPLDMPKNVRFGMFTLVSLLPGVSMLLCTIPVFFYDLVGKKKNQVLSELAKQREERGMVIQEQ